LFCAGCARHVPRSDRIPDTQNFWHGCISVAPAKPDGFQHFICTDVHDQQWEILVKSKTEKENKK
jgi:hypothetical protein